MGCEKLIREGSSNAQRFLEEKIWKNDQFLRFEFALQACECFKLAGLFEYDPSAEGLLLSTCPNNGRENIYTRGTYYRLNDDMRV